MPENTSIIVTYMPQIITAVITLIASSAGALLQSHLAAKKEMSKYLRDRKLDVYADALEILHIQKESLTLHIDTESEPMVKISVEPKSKDDKLKIDELWRKCNFRFSLLASENVNKEIGQIYDRILSMNDHLPKNKSEFIALANEFDELYYKLCDLMKKDLKKI